MTTTPVTQADRDAAADALQACGWSHEECIGIRSGALSHPVVKAMSDYRIVLTTPCRHEPYQGRCVHCDMPFKGGRPYSAKSEGVV